MSRRMLLFCVLLVRLFVLCFLCLGLIIGAQLDPILISAPLRLGSSGSRRQNFCFQPFCLCPPVNFLNLVFLCFLGFLLLVFCLFPEVG